MGTTRGGSFRHKGEQADKNICLPISVRSPKHTGRLSSSMEFQPSVCVPSIDPPTSSNSEDQRRQSKNNLNSTVLAKKTVVFVAADYVNNRSLDPSDCQSTLPRPLFPPSSAQLALDGVEFERQLLRTRGFSESLITTLLQSRKQSTTQIYTRIWKKFLQFHTVPHTAEVPIIPILEFLQKGKDLGLAVNTLRVQISALGALYGHNIAGNKWITRFITACERIAPIHIPSVPTWDLNLVLDALTVDPFEPIDTIPFKYLALKMALLVSLTSARRVGDIQALSIDPPFFQEYQDRLVLKPDPAYLPKVATKYHRSQEILLPTFYKNPSTPEEQKFHTLDVKRTVLKCIERSNSWRQSRALFVSFQGCKKGYGVTKSTISRWIREAIRLAYSAKNEDPPGNIRAHSTRAMATSWAEKGDVPIETICKAAVWSSPSTFYKHYRLDLSSTSDLSFGRTILGTVVPPR
ncbi:uncharacterized protein [Dendrobates tinctorius]|uniref:uncharacterized protein isoform X1 n=1 Tax=Dendrobates tinctorius TaxID=92724 RepID=UPI003CC9D53F